MTHSPAAEDARPLVQVVDLVKEYDSAQGAWRRDGRTVKAVDGVSFDIRAGETLGLVGESGCGKSTVARCLLRLIEPTSGSVLFDGEDVLKLKPEGLKRWRRQAQLIFQDPYASLNPRMTVTDIIAEPLRLCGLVRDRDVRPQVYELLDMVGLRREFAGRYPHEFSGGQRQRIAIARAIALRPKLVICDEPVTALDVSIRAQILTLLRDLQDEFGLTYLFIAHDLSLVRQVCDRVIVMYLGKIVEVAGRDALYAAPHHPYTQALLSAIPIPDPGRESARQRIVLEGEMPSPADPPVGCGFHTRCPKCQERCTLEAPSLDEVSIHHRAACFFPEPQPSMTGVASHGPSADADNSFM